VTEARVFERWEAPFDAWARAMDRPLAPLASSPSCPIADAEEPAREARLEILYPFDGARFVLDPERPTSLQTLDIRVSPFPAPVDVRVDGALVNTSWPLATGTHTIIAESKRASSAPVRISVR
jgi:hypothetical protein